MRPTPSNRASDDIGQCPKCGDDCHPVDNDAMIGTVVDPSELKKPRSWGDLETGASVAVPNCCANYFDLDWTQGRILRIQALERPSRNGASASKSHHVEVQVTDSTSIWITHLDLLRVIPAD